MSAVSFPSSASGQRPSPTLVFLQQGIATGFRDRTIVLIALLFLVLVMISAYLGWSATTTVDNIYKAAVTFMAANGQTVPPNPVLQQSPLGLLRNMATYVSLIGALAAIVLGNQLIADDRRAGLLPLIGSRPAERRNYGMGKALALLALLAFLVVFAAIINTATFSLLPQFRLDATGWLKLGEFYGLSWLYMAIFGFLGMLFAARSKSETVGLLVPVTIWLVMTFVMAQLTSNINPVAALNPVSALAAPPDGSFFAFTGQYLAPFSLAEAYRVLSAQLLDFMPPDYVVRAVISPLATLGIAAIAAGAVAVIAVARMDMSKGGYDA